MPMCLEELQEQSVYTYLPRLISSYTVLLVFFFFSLVGGVITGKECPRKNSCVASEFSHRNAALMNCFPLVKDTESYKTMSFGHEFLFSDQKLLVLGFMVTVKKYFHFC